MAVTTVMVMAVMLLTTYGRAGKTATAQPLPAPLPAPIREDSAARIHLYEFNFDPVANDLATTQGATESAVNSDDLGLFLVQFDGSPDDAQMNALGSGVTYVQYVPHNAFIVWTTPAVLREAANNDFVRWTGSFYPELRAAPDARAAADAGGAAPVMVDATFIDDGSLDQLASQIVAGGGAIDYREPTAVMSESLPAERWRFSAGGSGLAQVSRWPSLVSLALYTPPTIDETHTNSILAMGRMSVFEPWLANVGVDGSGVKVAVLDTGVDWDHPDLQNVTSGQELGGYSEPDQPGSDGGCTIDPNTNTCNVPGNPTGHGTHVAGSVAGTGASGVPVAARNGQRYGQGTAPGATLHAVDFIASDRGGGPDASSARIHEIAMEAGAALSTNSYGGDTSAGYTETARDRDLLALDVNTTDLIRQPIFMVHSAGNDGGKTPCPPGDPSNVRPCDSSLGVYAEAKNVLTVGAARGPHSVGNSGADVGNPGIVADWATQITIIADFSSRGPAIDGRVKPDVVAVGYNVISTENVSVDAPNGRKDMNCSDSAGLVEGYGWCSGTSMATPAVAGIAALFTQYWREVVLPDDGWRDPLANPEPATVKAAFIVSADRIGKYLGAHDGFGNTMREWPNGHEGWGRVNADVMLDPPVPVLYFENPTILDNQGDSWSIQVRRADPLEPMRVVLVWSDAPGAAGANPALVNDLDLLIIKPGTTDDYCGNEFEPNDQFFSLDCADGALKDDINNVEYVILPSMGTYDIQVKAATLVGNGVMEFGDSTDQHFSLVCYNCVEHYYVKNREETNLVAYWKFDDGQGPTVLNSVDGEKPLTLAGGSLATATPAPLGFTSYGYLNGLGSAGAAATAANHAGFNPQEDLSIAMWVRLTQRPAGTITTLFSHGNVHLSINGDNQLVMAVNNNIKASSITIPNDTWTHVAGTWSKDGYIRVYIDGVAGQGGIALSDGQSPGMSDAPVIIGANLYGEIDDVRFYSKRLNDYEIDRLKFGRECETTGTSWSDPFQFVGCGLTAASLAGGGEVRVAYGLHPYWPGTNRNASFVIPTGVTLAGGFEGIDRDAGDPLAFPTILSGDLDRNDGAGAAGLTGRNSYHVVRLGQDTTLDGFTIEHGLADGSGDLQGLGAGILSYADDSRTLRRLVVRDNRATGEGGGLYAFGSGNLLLDGTEFLGNKAGGWGGGAFVFSNSAFISNSIFSGNQGAMTGGLFFGGATHLRLTNSTLVGNTADFFGGLRVQGDARVDLTNSILVGNTAPNAPQLSISDTATPVDVSNNIIAGGFAGAGNFDVDPLLADPDGEDNVQGTIDDNLHLTRSSPAVDTGVNCAAADFTGAPRTLDGDLDGAAGCDRGAYEFGTLLVVTELHDPLDERVFYVTSLQAQGIPYEVWDTMQGALKPGAQRLSGHPRVLWSTSIMTSSPGPTGASETAVASWLDSGNRCFMLTSSFYLNGQGPTPPAFVQNYLGASSYDLDVNYQSSRGTGLFADKVYPLGAINLPKDWLKFNDRVHPDTAAGAITAFLYENGVPGNDQGVSLTTPTFRTALLGFPLSAVSRNRESAVADRGAILFSFFDKCEGTVAPGTGALTLTVAPNPLTYSAAGATITYNYTILNSGTKKLNGPFTVTDDRAGVTDPCGSGPLNAGATTTCAATYTVTQNDVTAGSISNTAQATGNGVTSPLSGATVTAATNTLVLNVSANPKSYTAVGNSITFTFVVRNDTSSTIDGPFAIDNDRLADISACGNSTLSAGAETSCTQNYTVTQDDLNNGSFSNIGVASGGGKMSAPTGVTVLAASGDLTLALSANKTTFSVAGEEIIYTYVVRNTGAATLDGPFTVLDDRTGTIAPCGSGPLAPNEQTSCTVAYSVTAGDVATGFITSTATVSGNGLMSAIATLTVQGAVVEGQFKILLPVVVRP